MRLLAIDPGHTTGIAYKDFSYDQKPTTYMPVGFSACTRMISDLMLGFPDLVIVERFTINLATTKKSRGGSNEAIELIGVTRYFCEFYGSEMAQQSPADAKNFCSDEKLKRLGWYVPGPDHARDALRHLVLAAVKCKILDPATLLQ